MPPGDWNQWTGSGRLLAAPVIGFTEQATQQATFTLECREVFDVGQVGVTLIPCLAYGRTVTEVAALQAGSQVTITGALGQQPDGSLVVHIRTIGGPDVPLPTTF